MTGFHRRRFFAWKCKRDHTVTWLLLFLLLLAGCGQRVEARAIGRANAKLGIFQRSQTFSEKNTSETAADLTNKRVAVLNGSLFDAFLSKNYPSAEVQRLETETDMILALQKGRCDALLIDNVPFLAAQRQYGNMTVVEEAMMTLDFGVAFRKDSTAFRDRFNKFLKETRDSGLYDEIYERWMLHTEEAVMPDISLATDENAHALRIGIAGTTEPYAFIRNGKAVGFDVELLTRFAASEGGTADFELLNFSGLIAALQSGKVDVASSGMAITDERKKAVAFSDPYFIGKGSLIMLVGGDTISSVSDKDAVESFKTFWLALKECFHNNLIVEARYQMILDGLGITLLIFLYSAVAGTLLGGMVCFLRMRSNKPLRAVAKTYIDLMRGIPVLVFLMLMYYVVFAPLGTSAITVAVITFSMNFAAYFSEMFRTSIESIDRGQTEAGIALGFTRIQTFIYILLPQAVKNVLPVYKGELISLLKMTSIVGYIAVVDLTKASDIIRARTFDAFFPLVLVALIYFLVAWLVGILLDYLGRDKTNHT